MSLFSRFSVQIQRIINILTDTEPLLVDVTQKSLCFYMSLRQRFLKPFFRFYVITFNAFAVMVHSAKLILSVFIPLIGGLLQQLERLPVILADSPAVKIHQAEIALC